MLAAFDHAGNCALESPITNWLRAAAAGDVLAGDRAYALIYDELRALAVRQLGRAGAQSTLTPTALVSEAFLKLAGGSLASLNDRRHLFNLAARAMRQIVIDYARERLAQKRGGDLVRTQLDDEFAESVWDPMQTLATEQALARLERQDAELAETLGWRVFAGLSAQQIAELRGKTLRSVNRDLMLARKYLALALGHEA
jgi:RNA polymerase sigma factor (TIGR02999 family)